MRKRTVFACLLFARIGLATPASPFATGAGAGADSGDHARRRSVRGVTIPDEESPALKEMARFEAERFGAARRRWLGNTERLGALPAPVEPPPRYAHLVLPDIPVRWDERLVAYLDFYKNERRGRAIMGGWLRLQGRYRERIEAALTQSHLPRALLYVAMIESGYDPLDRSWAGAAGLWQFMPEGGRIYGLRIDRWVDERNDPDKATTAVMHYFGDLHARFGSWHLALAAFNAGYGALIAAVQKYNTNDYWALAALEDGLPFETVAYVPKALAAAIVGENRAAFGFAEVVPLAPVEPDRVEVLASTSIEAIAEAAGVDASQVSALNPELRLGRTPPERWTVKLPRGAGPRFLKRSPALVERFTPHLFRVGERLETLARAHHTSVKELRRLNGIRDLAELRPGITLLVPSIGERGKTEKPEPAADAESDAGTTIVALPEGETAVDGRKRIFYRVAPGDGLAELARLFGVSEPELCAWNRLDPDANLVGGMILQMWVDPDADTGLAALDPAHLQLVTVGSDAFFDTVEARRGRKRIRYEVRRGDTWKSIAAHFHLGEGDVERINRIGRTSALAAGQALTIYVPLSEQERDEAQRLAHAQPARSAAAADCDPEALVGFSVEAGGDLRDLMVTAPTLRAVKVDSDDTPATAPPPIAPCEDPALAQPVSSSEPEPRALPRLVATPLARSR